MIPLDCLAHAVYYEARGETRAGQEAVAHVVLNRGGSICKTVYKGCQFSWVCKPVKAPYGTAWLQARRVAADVLKDPNDNTGGATHFHTGRSPYWAASMRFTIKIGRHKFYAPKG
jgi:spore germination cell wall hydrolase CwlJ-like protein